MRSIISLIITNWIITRRRLWDCNRDRPIVKRRRRFAKLRSSPAKEFCAVSTNCSPIIHIDKNSQQASGEVFWRSGATPLLARRRFTWPFADRTLRHTAGKNAKHPTLAYQRSSTSTPTPAHLLLHPWLLLCPATDCSIVSDASNRCWYNIYRWWERLVFSPGRIPADTQTDIQTFRQSACLVLCCIAQPPTMPLFDFRWNCQIS